MLPGDMQSQGPGGHLPPGEAPSGFETYGEGALDTSRANSFDLTASSSDSGDDAAGGMLATVDGRPGD